MTNQKYIEEIIKVAEKGDYKFKGLETGFDRLFISRTDYKFDIQFCNDDVRCCQTWAIGNILLDPNFFKAIGKVKGWHTKMNCGACDPYEGTVCHRVNIEDYKGYMHTFLDKIIEKDLDHAIEWLYNLIKDK